MYFVVIFGCCCMSISLHLDGYLLQIADRCHIWIACHFQTVTLIPAFFISFSSDFISSFQWHTWFSKLRPCSCISCHILHFASRIASRIAYHRCIILFDPCTWLIVSLLLVYLVWVEPGDEFANKEPVEFAFEDPVNSDNFAGKMIIPSKSLLSLLC